jgi:hypothetical protein
MFLTKLIGKLVQKHVKHYSTFNQNIWADVLSAFPLKLPVVPTKFSLLISIYQGYQYR